MPLAFIATVAGPAGAAGTVPAAVVAVDWQDLGRRPGLSGVAVVSARYVIRRAGDGGVVVERRPGRQTVLRHRPSSAEYETTFVDVAGDTLVVADEDTKADKGASRAYVYDLKTAARTLLTDVASAPTPSEFGAQAVVTDDGRYYYQATGSVGGRARTCVAMLDLHTLIGRTVECATDDQTLVGYYVRAGHDGATWMNWRNPEAPGCRFGRGVRGGAVVEVAPAQGCGLLASTTLGPWDIWVGSPGNPPPVVPIHAVHGSDVIDLGLIDGVALSNCGSYVYWRFTDVQHRTIQLRRWKPVAPMVEIVYALNDPAEAAGIRQLVLGGCADGIFALSVVEGSSTEGDWVRLLALRP